MLIRNALLFLLATCSTLLATESTFTETAPGYKKIYVNSDEILISEDGIFFATEIGSWEKTSGVYFDSKGLFVMQNFYWCPSCGRVNRDGNCTNPACPMKGK